MSSVFSRKMTMSTFSGVLHRRGHALEVAHRAQADVEVEHLAQRDVERADAAADRRGQRTLDADQISLNAATVSSGSQLLNCLEGLLAREHLEPGDLALAAVGLLHRRVEHALRWRARCPAGAVTLDERDDRVVGNVQLAVL